jgi:hypothetical protein
MPKPFDPRETTMKYVVLTCALLTTTALAHESKGPNGGRQVDAGKNHVELVAQGSTLEVYVSDAAGKPLDPSAFKGVAILVVNGKPARIQLSPSSDKLVGKAQTEISNTVKGAIQITDAMGVTSQAKFD